MLEGSLTSPTPRYEALSYTWGEASITQPILLGGHPFQVTLNLQQALYYLRRHHQVRTLWIDAICINQSDNTEKEQQVSFMHQIFANAQTVIVWLGEPSIDSDMGMRFVQSIHECFNPPSSAEEEEQVLDWVDAIGQSNGMERLVNPAHACHWIAFHGLLKRSWWNRAWVMQELLVAKRVLICCGQASVDWVAFRVAVPLGRMANLEIVQCIVEGTSFNICSTEEIYTMPIYLIEPAFRLVARKVARSDEGAREAQRANGLTSWLSGTRHLACKTPHDKVYSVLGLASEAFRKAIVPDYSEAIEELFVRTAKEYIETSGWLNIISHSQHSKWQGNMPSWVPDWRRHERATSFADVAVTNGHHASGGTRASVAVSSDCSMVLADGVCIGTVTDIQLEDRLMPDLTKETKRYTSEGEIISGSEGYDTVYWHFVRSAEALLYPAMELLDAEDPLWADHLDLFLRAVQIQRKHGPVILEDPSKVQSHSGLQSNLLEQEVPLHLPRFYDHLQGLLTSRTIVSLHDGRICIAPDFTEVGDLVCILFGCDSAVVLRRRDDSYSFVGDCWCYQMMDGEAIEMLDEVSLKQETFSII
jgi:hypothetical protein